MKKFEDVLSEAKKKGYYTDKNGNIFSSRKQLSLVKRVKRDGYTLYHFSIRYFDQRETIPVHKFIAYLKYGSKIFDEGIVVRHFDNNSLNIHISKIIILTILIYI